MKRVQLFFDRLLHNVLNPNSVSIVSFHPNGRPQEEHYEGLPSVRIAVITGDGEILHGRYKDVVYRFDERGTIISRRRLKDMYKEQGNLIIGNNEVVDALLEYSRMQYEPWERRNFSQNERGEFNLG